MKYVLSIGDATNGETNPTFPVRDITYEYKGLEGAKVSQHVYPTLAAASVPGRTPLYAASESALMHAVWRALSDAFKAAYPDYVANAMDPLPPQFQWPVNTAISAAPVDCVGAESL